MFSTERLLGAIQELLGEALGSDVVWTEDGGMRVRLTPWPGMRSFVTVEQHPEALFSPLWKVGCSTILGNVADDDADLSGFLDACNFTAIGGNWVLYGNGDLGVTGHLLTADPEASALGPLVAQLLALQVDEAIAVSLPPGCVPFEDLHQPVRPPLGESSRPFPPVAEIANHLSWRSGHHDAERWPVAQVGDDYITLLAPEMVTDSVLTIDGEPRQDLRTVTVADASHPRQGPGVLIQVSLLGPVRDQAPLYRHFGVLTDSGRWYGTGLGAFMFWGRGESSELVYRAFLPCRLLGALSEQDALDLVGDVTLGAVNVTGIAEQVIRTLAATDDPDRLAAALEVTKSEALKRYRVSALRAATHIRPRPDGLTDAEGPLVDVGAAVLDRLAIEQLQIHTAPFLISERSFSWLPGPHPQIISATAMRPSRRHEITEVVLTTELGAVTADQIEATLEACVEISADLPLCSAISDPEGRVVISSRIMLHEGVWWHRAELVNVLAAMQLNLADGVAASFDLRGVTLTQDTALYAALSNQGILEGYDSIYDVVPHLRHLVQQYPVPVEEVLELAGAKLLERPFSRLFGELDDAPDVVVLAYDAHDDGGWDPPIGEVMVTLESVDHPIAGPSLKVRVNPGYLPGGPGLALDAHRLMTFTHGIGGLALCPSWEVTRPTVSTTLTVPRMAVSASGVDTWVELTLQAVNSSISALARVVAAWPDAFPGFDRSQINLTRSDPAYPETDPSLETVVWAPLVNLRVIGFAEQPGRFERWQEVPLHHDDAKRFADWLTGGDPAAAFDHPDLQAVAAEGDRIVRTCDREYRLQPAAARALAAQLRYPEAAATGRIPGRIITYALEDWIDEDGDTVLLLPPAQGLQRLLDEEDITCAGVSAVTASSFFLRFSASSAFMDLDIPIELGDQLLASADENSNVTLTVAFPSVDPRVTSMPPDAWVGQISALELAAALDEIRRS